jgi:putative peptidoglycan lipid II flippase
MQESNGGSEGRAIARRASVVASGTLISRILGAVRDAVIAACFPVHGTDAFFVAFTIPNSLRVLLGEGAVANAFIPVFSELKEKHGLGRARAFYAALTGAMLLVLAGVTAAGILLARPLVTLYAAGFRSQPGKFETTVELTRLLFPYIFFMGAAALGMAALNALRRFFVPAFAPALLNVSLIAAPFVFVPVALFFGMPPLGALGIGVLVGGLLQAAVQLPALGSVGMLNRPRLGFDDPGVRKAFRLMAPLMLGVGVYQVNVMLTRLFASYLPSGSQSYLYYGQRLVEIPQGMFALAIASATLPSLADLRNRGEHDEAKQTFAYGIRLSLFVAIPSSVLLAVLAGPVVTVFFARGAFGGFQAAETARSLVWMAAGVWAIAAVRGVVQMFFAYNDTRTPVLCSALNLAVFASLSLLLMQPMRHMGIAAATSAAAVVQLGALLLLLRRRIGAYPVSGLLFCALRCAVAGALAGAAAYAVAMLGRWEAGGNDPRNIAVLLLCLLSAGLLYLLVARLLRSPELGDILGLLRRAGHRGGA